MKKHLEKRNERLFNKLFESQGIKSQINENVGEIEDVKEVQDPIKDAAFKVLEAANDLLRAGATEEDVHDLLKSIDAKASYKADAAGGAYNSLFESSKAIEELGVPEMTAWQALEKDDEELTEASPGVLINPEDEEAGAEDADDVLDDEDEL